ncbi:MAG: CotH kinase family protein, partial [Cystobacter sp.]
MGSGEEQAAPKALGLAQPLPAHFTYPPLQTTVEQYTLEIDPKLLALFFEDEDTPAQPAVFTAPGGQRTNVHMRLRGNSSRSWPKKSWRIEWPEGKAFEGRRKLNLLSEWREATMMLEKLGYDMLEAMGVPAPRGKYVRLTINGHYQGVYLDLERVDKSFLSNHGFADTDGSIYRCGGKNCEMKTSFDRTYQRDWEKMTNEKQPSEALSSFLALVNHTPEPQFVQALTERFELERHLRELAVDALISNATVEDSRSYVIHDAVTGRFSYVPWDFNNTDAKYSPGGKRRDADYEHPLFNFSLLDGRVEDEYLDRAKDEPGRWKPIF